MPNKKEVLGTIVAKSHNVISCLALLFQQSIASNNTWGHLETAHKILNIAGIDDLAKEIKGMLEPSADSTNKVETPKPHIQSGTNNASEK